MTAMPPRFTITPEQIDDQMRAFYIEIRRHPVLGPVFNTRIGTDPKAWRTHEDKIASFWRNAILFERSYNGNPQKVHGEREAVEPEHFAVWLDLFDEVLKENLPPEQAAAWSNLAHRIGRGLKMGVVQSRAKYGDVPDLG
ncbi:MAG: globin family protein [Marinosulfonomonas sp.]|nr:MAG: globin family protein [Marinosulfonomonas sp.]